MSLSSVNEFERTIGYTFSNRKLVSMALTHSSFANESKEDFKSNERLEFLGDSVLGFIVSDYIFSGCPHFLEGDLTKLRAALVCEKALAKFARQLNMGDFIKLSKGERRSGGYDRDSILADAFESVIAAIYLDGGLEPVKKFVLRFVLEEFSNIDRKDFYDYKTRLQEIVQKQTGSRLRYTLVSESGPEHQKTFVVEARIKDKIYAKGSGNSKKEAEQRAAYEVLKVLETQQNRK